MRGVFDPEPSVLPEKITAATIRGALKRNYAAPEAAIAFEVAQSTGYAARRHVDAIAMELWPSRGLALTAIEIKVDRGDWRREKRDPAKAEEVARFCDYFLVAAPKGIVPVEELPSAWGLLELMPSGKFRVAKAATKTPAEPIDRAFLAAIMRASTRAPDGDTIEAIVDERRRALQAEFDERLKREASRQHDANKDDAEKWRALVADLGLDRWESTDRIKTAIKLVLKTGVADTYGGLAGLLETLSGMAAKIKAAGEELGVDLTPPSEARAVLYGRLQKKGSKS